MSRDQKFPLTFHELPIQKGRGGRVSYGYIWDWLLELAKVLSNYQKRFWQHLAKSTWYVLPERSTLSAVT